MKKIFVMNIFFLFSQTAFSLLSTDMKNRYIGLDRSLPTINTIKRRLGENRPWLSLDVLNACRRLSTNNNIQEWDACGFEMNNLSVDPVVVHWCLEAHTDRLGSKNRLGFVSCIKNLANVVIPDNILMECTIANGLLLSAKDRLNCLLEKYASLQQNPRHDLEQISYPKSLQHLSLSINKIEGILKVHNLSTADRAAVELFENDLKRAYQDILEGRPREVIKHEFGLFLKIKFNQIICYL